MGIGTKRTMSLAVAALLAASLARAGDLPRLVAVAPRLTGVTDETPTLRQVVRDEQGAVILDRLPEDHPAARWLAERTVEGPLVPYKKALARARRAAHAAGRSSTPAPDAPVLVCFAERFAAKGPSYWGEVPVVAPATADFPEARAPGFVMLAPLRYHGEVYTWRALDAAGLLETILVHELVHVLTGESYGDEYLKLKALADPFVKHAAPKVTDPATAVIEGLAIAAEAAAGEAYPDHIYPEPGPDAPPALAEAARGLRKRRLVHVDQRHYMFQGNGEPKQGELDAPADAMATEGIVATLTRGLAAELDPNDGLAELGEILARRRPRDFPGIVLALKAERPDLREVFDRILLEYTRYAWASADAGPRYRAAYLARRAWLRGEARPEDAAAAEETWEAWKASMRERIEAGASVMAALPLRLVVRAADGTDVDLNGPMEELREQLRSLAPEGVDPELLAARLGKAREPRGGRFEVVGEALDVAGPARDALEAARARWMEAEEARLAVIAEDLRKRRQEAAFAGEIDPRFDLERSAKP